ncbi:MAG: selenide, water dikinase SelD [Ginsengibacter sp.]
MITNDDKSGEPVRLTQYSHGAGCGCKISPAVLDEILKSSFTTPNQNLLVGNSSKDDAAVYDIGNGNALISTTDFFTPIVDDPYDFGRIASANAISDVYAMGGKPILALAILGWPVEKLSADLARKVIEGSREVCKQAGIPLAGGHSIDAPEPMFGLAVNGMVSIAHLKKNDTANEGDILFLTKPIGVGILATAQKRGLLQADHRKEFMEQLTRLNSIGERMGSIKAVTAMTDVTGFGLLGHLIEMAESSNLSAELNYSRVRIIAGVKEYLSHRIVPDATFRNWNSYSSKVKFSKGLNVMEAFSILPDPQTNGGLLIAVDPAGSQEVMLAFEEYGIGLHTEPVGTFIKKQEKTVLVKD